MAEAPKKGLGKKFGVGKVAPPELLDLPKPSEEAQGMRAGPVTYVAKAMFAKPQALAKAKPKVKAEPKAEVKAEVKAESKAEGARSVAAGVTDGKRKRQQHINDDDDDEPPEHVPPGKGDKGKGKVDLKGKLGAVAKVEEEEEAENKGDAKNKFEKGKGKVRRSSVLIPKLRKLVPIAYSVVDTHMSHLDFFF